MIQIIKKAGGSMTDSFLEDGFILDKQIGVGQPKRVENARILVANTPMDTDKIKIYGAYNRAHGAQPRSPERTRAGARVKVDSMEAVAEIETAEKEKMKAKVEKILKHNCT